MRTPGKRRNRKQKPSSRSPNEDTILSHYGEYILPRAMMDGVPSRSQRCKIELCKPCTCWLLIRSLRRRLTRTLTDFGEGARRQMRLKPASSHSVETTGHNGFSKGIYAPASTESRRSGS